MDQFVISNLMKLENQATKGHATVAADPFWRELENRIADAPFVKLQSLMFAAIAMRAAQGQKEPPNKGTATDIDTGGAPVTLLRCDIHGSRLSITVARRSDRVAAIGNGEGILVECQSAVP